MTDDTFAVAAAAGSLRDEVRADVALAHAWTDEGVALQLSGTGAHLLHASIALCVLNDLYREARGTPVRVTGVRVDAEGSFDTSDWHSEGVGYRVRLEQEGGSEEEVAALLARVDEVAEIPRVLRAGAGVVRR